MDDFEVSTLKRAFSEKLVIPKGMTDVKPQQKNDFNQHRKRIPSSSRRTGSYFAIGTKISRRTHRRGCSCSEKIKSGGGLWIKAS